MRNERELSRRCEGWLRPRLVMGWLLFRSRRQRRDIGGAAVVLALSDAFGRHLAEDYGVDPTRIRIAPTRSTSKASVPPTRPSSGGIVEGRCGRPDLGSQGA